MFRSALVVPVVLISAMAIVGCDDDGGGDVDVDSTLVDDPDVPFDPDVPAGQDTETDEIDNQGFDPQTPGGPLGNNAELSD